MTNYYWKDGADDDFLNSDAWLPSGVPQEFDSAYVAIAGTYTVTVSAGESAEVGDLTISNADATLAINGGELYVDDGLNTAGSIVLDNGPYQGASLLAYGLTCAGSLDVDAYDGSGGARIYVVESVTLGGPLVVGNADLSADTQVVDAGYFFGDCDISVTGAMQPGGAEASVSFQYSTLPPVLDDTISVTGDAELQGVNIASIGPTGVISVDGAEAEILGAITPDLNQGSILADNGAKLALSGNLDNTGLISADNGGMISFGSVVNSGTISLLDDSEDVGSDGGLLFFGDLTNNGGIYVNNDGADASVGDVEFDVFGAFDNQGSFILDANVTNPAAATYARFGSLQNSGLFEIGGGLAHDSVLVSGTATADHDVMQIGANASLTASLVMTGTADLDVAGGAVSGAVVAEDSSVALVQAGTFSDVSTTLISGGTEIISSGVVEGPSIAAGNLYLGQGATLSSPVSFTPSGGSIALFRSSLSSLQVDGLSPLAQVDVFDVPYALGAPAPILVNDAQQHNVLQFSDAQYNLVDLQLDPTANYAGVKFIVQPYLNGVAISEST